MKKFLPLFLTFPIIFAYFGYGNFATNKKYTVYETTVVSTNNTTEKQNTSTAFMTPAATGSIEKNTTDKISVPTTSIDKSNTDITPAVAEKKQKVSVNIAVGSKTFTVALEDTATAKAFSEKLPLTLEMSELNGNEKYNYLSSNLSSETSSCPGTIKEGDLMLYGDSYLVLFYKTFHTSYSYIKLGHMDNTTGLAEALGSGNVKVTFSVKD